MIKPFYESILLMLIKYVVEETRPWPSEESEEWYHTFHNSRRLQTSERSEECTSTDFKDLYWTAVTSRLGGSLAF